MQDKLTKIPVKYMCDECQNVHDDHWRAEECCPPAVSKVYVCPICSDALDTEAEARSCCDLDSRDLPDYRPCAEELEQHGQLRLEAMK